VVVDSLDIITFRPACVKVLLRLLETKDFWGCQRRFTASILPLLLPLYCGDAAFANW
jgi:hypothetical protein